MSHIFYSTARRPYAHTEKMAVWAKERCPSYITVDAERREDDWYYRFYFDDERDYLMFALRWS